MELSAGMTVLTKMKVAEQSKPLPNGKGKGKSKGVATVLGSKWQECKHLLK